MHDWPDWSGKTCTVMASGPSLTKEQAEKTRHLPTIVVNNSWRMAPWADVLFASDRKWWQVNEGAPDFRGLKVSRQGVAKEWGIREARTVSVRHGITGKVGEVCNGGNSGFMAFSMAVSFNPSAIILLGFDMHVRNGTHWHGDHEKMGNPREGRIKAWIGHFADNAEKVKQMGIKVYNCSPDSDLDCFVKMPLGECLRLQS